MISNIHSKAYCISRIRLLKPLKKYIFIHGYYLKILYGAEKMWDYLLIYLAFHSSHFLPIETETILCFHTFIINWIFHAQHIAFLEKLKDFNSSTIFIEIYERRWGKVLYVIVECKSEPTSDWVLSTFKWEK